MWGNHMIKSWSLTQSTVSLSSGEAEYYAIVKGGSVGLGMRTMLKELGVEINVKISTDASAAIGMIKRRGLGRVRHIDVSQLWIQTKVQEGEFKLRKVDTKENLSDALTMNLSTSEIQYHLKGTFQQLS